jgi:multiple sugar transport system permease protein
MSATVAGALPRTKAKHPSLHRQRAWAFYGSYAALMVFVVMFLVPPFYTIITSLKSAAEISAQKGSPWLIHHPTLENFWYLITYPNFQTYFMNTVYVTIAVVVVTMVISVLAAFSLARMGFWGSTFLATGVFLTYLVPASLLFIPLFQVIGKIGLINNVWCLVLLYPTLSVPFCTWIMIGYFSSIPKELDEAALIDGAGYLQMLWKIFIPVAMPGIIAATIFAFTVSWGSLLYPARLSLHVQPDGADRRHHQRPHSRRRVPVGQDHGRLRDRRRPAGHHLRLPDGLLRRRPDRRRNERLKQYG